MMSLETLFLEMLNMIDKKENRQFKSFVAEMYNFLFSTGQWKSLPDAKGGYD